MKRKKKNFLTGLAIVGITLVSVLIAVVLAININQDPSTGTKSIQFDWLETACSLLSGAASVILGVVAIVQTDKANKLTEELAEIDRFQYENSVMSQDCPLLRFAKLQQLDIRDHTFALRFVDTKNIPTKSIYLNNIYLYPYLRDDKADETEPHPVQPTPHPVRAKFIPYHHHRRGLNGYYTIELKVDPTIFQKYQNYLLEFDLGVINAAEVANVYKYKLLMKTPEKTSHIKLQLKVMHQFYEIETVVGEDKFKESIDND